MPGREQGELRPPRNTAAPRDTTAAPPNVAAPRDMTALGEPLPRGCGVSRIVTPAARSRKKKCPPGIYPYSLVIYNSPANPRAMQKPPTSLKGCQAGDSLGPLPWSGAGAAVCSRPGRAIPGPDSSTKTAKLLPAPSAAPLPN